MCEICNKQCYQTALINDNVKEEVTGLCYEIDPKCDKIIVIDNELYCTCSNNPERIEYKEK